MATKEELWPNACGVSESSDRHLDQLAEWYTNLPPDERTAIDAKLKAWREEGEAERIKRDAESQKLFDRVIKIGRAIQASGIDA